MWHWGKPPPTELFHNPLGKFALCYCHTKVVVKVGPEVLQQVSSSLPFLSGNSLLNSGFPETAYFAPHPTAHDEHRAHIKYRGELDHMTILHISITSALHQHYISIISLTSTKSKLQKNKYARTVFPDWKAWVCKLPSPCTFRGTQVCHYILNTQMAWCVVYRKLIWCLQYILVHGVGIHVIGIQKIRVGNTEMTFWSVTTESDLKNETIFIQQLGQYWHCSTEL